MWRCRNCGEVFFVTGFATIKFYNRQQMLKNGKNLDEILTGMHTSFLQNQANRTRIDSFDLEYFSCKNLCCELRTLRLKTMDELLEYAYWEDEK